MSIKKITRLEYINDLITIRSTGTAMGLAKRLHVSKMTIYRDIELIRELGADIEFEKNQNTFFYVEKFTLDKKKLEKLLL